MAKKHGKRMTRWSAKRRFIAYLRDRELSHSAMATMLGVSQSTVSSWISGRRIPSKPKQDAIKAILEEKALPKEKAPPKEPKKAKRRVLKSDGLDEPARPTFPRGGFPPYGLAVATNTSICAVVAAYAARPGTTVDQIVDLAERLKKTFN